MLKELQSIGDINPAFLFNIQGGCSAGICETNTTWKGKNLTSKEKTIADIENRILATDIDGRIIRTVLIGNGRISRDSHSASIGNIQD